MSRPIDATDFYLFRSYETGRSNYFTAIANFNPLQDTFGGPNYYPLSDKFFYEIYLDNTGDGVEDFVFQFMFGSSLGNGNQGIKIPVGDQMVAVPLKFIGQIQPPNVSTAALNFIEYYSLGLITGARTGTPAAITNARDGSTKFYKPFDNVGEKAIPDYRSYANNFIYNINIPGCGTEGKLFVGQRKDSFSVSLGHIFDLVDLVPIAGSAFPGGVNDTNKLDDLKRKAVTEIALELPISCFAGSDGVVGGWTAVRKLKHVGDNHVAGNQDNRLGNPLINEVVIGLPDKDRWNMQQPSGESQFLLYYQYPTLPVLIDILFLNAVNSVLGANLTQLSPTFLPRIDIVQVALLGVPGLNLPANAQKADILRLNTSVPTTAQRDQNNMGVIGGDNAGYPNGRRLGDDVVDILLRVFMGKLCYIQGLGLCTPAQAPVGNYPITDGSPQNALQFDVTFPYMRPPKPGSRPPVSVSTSSFEFEAAA